MRDSGGMLPVRYGRSIDLGSSVYESNAEHEFVLWTVAASSEDAGKFKYQLPDNVVEVHEVFLQDALKLASVKKKYKFTERELKALTDFVIAKGRIGMYYLKCIMTGKFLLCRFLRALSFWIS